MKLRNKIGLGFLMVLVVGFVTLGFVLSYEAECPEPTAGRNGPNTMQSIRYHCYGSPEVLRLEHLERPTPADDELLVRVHAAAVNPLDWHYMRGEPYIMRLMSGIGAPNDPTMGVDFAGTVEAVGKNVSKFRPGDEVFGGRSGAFSEYITINQDRAVALMPANVSFEEAAAVGIAGITALQGLRDKGQVQAGDKVLINGASGGVGSFAVQIAKAMGAEVTGVCSERNAEMVRSIGADHVIDYRQQDFTELGKRYDVILDNVGNHPLLKVRNALEPEGRLVMVGNANQGKFIGPLWRPVRATLADLFIEQSLVGLLAKFNQGDLITLAELMREQELRPVIDRTYAFTEIRQAIEYSESGSARAKIIVRLP